MNTKLFPLAVSGSAATKNKNYKGVSSSRQMRSGNQCYDRAAIHAEF
ncbi:MAG TPA: hypothetical protein V6D12_11150 [Candidatus Obscuribacterales bacterium]